MSHALGGPAHISRLAVVAQACPAQAPALKASGSCSATSVLRLKTSLSRTGARSCADSPSAARPASSDGDEQSSGGAQAQKDQSHLAAGHHASPTTRLVLVGLVAHEAPADAQALAGTATEQEGPPITRPERVGGVGRV